MKTAISVPDLIYQAAEKLAARLGMTRSALYTKAVQRFLLEHRNDMITEKLDEVYEKEDSRLDPLLEVMQKMPMQRDGW